MTRTPRDAGEAQLFLEQPRELDPLGLRQLQRHPLGRARASRHAFVVHLFVVQVLGQRLHERPGLVGVEIERVIGRRRHPASAAAAFSTGLVRQRCAFRPDERRNTAEDNDGDAGRRGPSAARASQANGPLEPRCAAWRLRSRPLR